MAQTTPLPTADSAASLANKTVGEIVQNAISFGEAALIAWQPWLNLPVFKQIWERLFSYFVTQVGNFLGVGSAYVVIDAQKYFNLMSAASALAKLNAAKQSGDSNAISQASSAVDAAVTPILQYVGDART